MVSALVPLLVWSSSVVPKENDTAVTTVLAGDPHVPGHSGKEE